MIAPNEGDHLDCEECGMCIDICPVGALTSGAYRYKTRPWEMKHVGTVCTHCGDGCKTTLGVRRSDTGMEIVRGDNRDKSGMNGDFLCIKGRYAFDFANNEERLRLPLIKRNGKHEEATWEEAFELIAAKFKEAGSSIGVIGSNRTTNEENYLLQKFARAVLKTNNIDHHRTADYPAFVSALAGTTGKTARCATSTTAPAMLLIGNDPTEQHPLLAWQIRNNVRLHRSRLYVVNSSPIKLRRQAVAFAQLTTDNGEVAFVSFLDGNSIARAEPRREGTTAQSLTDLRDKLRAKRSWSSPSARNFAPIRIVELVKALPNAKFICLGDYANSRGASDMGLYPDLLPGYVPVGKARCAVNGWPMLPRSPASTRKRCSRPRKTAN